LSFLLRHAHTLEGLSQGLRLTGYHRHRHLWWAALSGADVTPPSCTRSRV